MSTNNNFLLVLSRRLRVGGRWPPEARPLIKREENPAPTSLRSNGRRRLRVGRLWARARSIRAPGGRPPESWRATRHTNRESKLGEVL